MATDHGSRLHALIEGNQHMTLATADAAGQPWASPVFYAYDEEHRLYWVSAKNARHSENIRARPQVGIVIYQAGDHTDALYIEAEAEELNDQDEVVPAIAVMQSRPQPPRWMIKDVTDITGDAVWRIYRAIPMKLYLREEATEGGQAIARRRSVDL
jgi:nitroimidazol reductase NimA-like FMN-containing flavoprotein (pyridoxamine 5'-phosphate oxidase superfamily)